MKDILVSELDQAQLDAATAMLETAVTKMSAAYIAWRSTPEIQKLQKEIDIRKNELKIKVTETMINSQIDKQSYKFEVTSRKFIPIGNGEVNVQRTQ